MKKIKYLPSIKLKHLDVVAQDVPEYATIMKEELAYSNNWFSRKLNFIKKFKTAFLLVNEIRQINPIDLTWTEDCPIKKPTNIDFITFQAMMELQALLNGAKDSEDFTSLIAESISIACFSAHHPHLDYDSESEVFKSFKQEVLNSKYVDMFGLYNWIVQSLTESAEGWNQRFFSVEIKDDDYEAAGGSRMSQFNVISTIKSICEDFNLPFKDAWQLSYNLVQTNSYAKATQNHIQDNMRILKEAKMNAKRNNN